MIFNQDCINGMRSLATQIDLAITSPPYKNSDNYSEKLIYDFGAEVFRLLKDNSLFFINFGHLAEDKFRPFRVCQILMELGFKLNETVVWAKNHYKPIQGKRRLNNLTEFIFILYKGEMPEIDRLSIGAPYKDKSNVKRYAGGQDLKCRGNLWEIPYETIQSGGQKSHPDRFPLTLPVYCIKLSGIKAGSIVLDPFCGSGTTCLAAKNLGMDYIGFEKNEEYFKRAKLRLS